MHLVGYPNAGCPVGYGSHSVDLRRGVVEGSHAASDQCGRTNRLRSATRVELVQLVAGNVRMSGTDRIAHPSVSSALEAASVTATAASVPASVTSPICHSVVDPRVERSDPVGY